jgi:hypothetical protein
VEVVWKFRSLKMIASTNMMGSTRSTSCKTSTTTNGRPHARQRQRRTEEKGAPCVGEHNPTDNEKTKERCIRVRETAEHSEKKNTIERPRWYTALITRVRRKKTPPKMSAWWEDYIEDVVGSSRPQQGLENGDVLHWDMESDEFRDEEIPLFAIRRLIDPNGKDDFRLRHYDASQFRYRRHQSKLVITRRMKMTTATTIAIAAIGTTIARRLPGIVSSHVDESNWQLH